MSVRRIVAVVLVMTVIVLLLAGCVRPDVQDTIGHTTQNTLPGTTAGTTANTHPSVTPTTQSADPKPQPTPPPTTIPPTTQPPTESATAPTVPPTSQPTVPTTTVPPNRPAPLPTTVSPTYETTIPPTTQPEEAGAIPNRVTVEASGVLVKDCSKAVIDYSNTADGYVMVRYTQPTEKKLKAQIKGPTTTYTYNLTPEKWAAFPLSDENGEYKITVYQNIVDTKYAVVLSLTVTVQMKDEFAPFLRANQYVDFDAAPQSVAKAAALTAGITDPLKKVEKIYDFVVGTLSYDKELAATVKSGYLPDLDRVLEKKKGICFDYAALMTGMLRSQGVPTKLVVGYAGSVYHAWISVWSESTGWVDGVIYFDGVSWQRMDPTFASSGGSSPDILDYIGNGSNYIPKYFY